MIGGIGNIQPLRGVTCKITFNEFNAPLQKITKRQQVVE